MIRDDADLERYVDYIDYIPSNTDLPRGRVTGHTAAFTAMSYGAYCLLIGPAT